MSISFRTSPPANYLPPNKEEMREEANKVGLQGFSESLVADLCNLAAGGKINPPSSYIKKIQEGVSKNLPSPNNGSWKLPNGKNTKNRMEAVNESLKYKMKYHQNVCDFLQASDIEKFPGNSPLEQAMAMLKLLSKMEGGAGGENGNMLPIFQENKFPEGVANELHEVMELTEDLTQEELDLMDDDQNSYYEDSKDEEGMEVLNSLKVAEDLVNGSNKRVMLEISRKLDKFTKLQVRRQKVVKPDPAGEEIRNRPIKHLGELNKVSKSAWATRQGHSAYFMYQAVTGQLPVRERVTRQEKKQAILILVDGSGSMSGEKHYKATGVVMNRLKAVISGDAEVWISVFDTNMSKPSHASNEEEARDLIKSFKNNNFSGGSTNIAAAVKTAHNFIEEKIVSGEALWKPEIVVLTDEDPSISNLKKSQIKGTTVHGFAMSVKNTSLVAFAKSTGGVGIDQF